MAASSLPAESSEISSASVYLLIGGLQVVAVERLVRQDPADFKLCINLSGMNISLPRDVWLHAPQGQSSISQLLFYRKILRVLQSLRKKAAFMSVAIPHPFHSIGNYLAFGLGADAIDLLPDGALNYYRRELTDVDSAKQRRKTRLLRLLGVGYTGYQGDMDGADAIRYRSVYTLMQAHMKQYDASAIVPLSIAPQGLQTGHAALFVDQPVLTWQRPFADRLIQRVSELLGEAQGVYYKPHPSGPRENFLPAGIATSDLDPRTPVEHLVKDLPIDRVVGVNSTSLMTIKLAYPDLRCVAVGAKLLNDALPTLKQLCDAMQAAGVEFAEIEGDQEKH